MIMSDTPSPKPPKLKFGVDRLLSPDEPKPIGSTTQIVAPRPTVAVPCSDCVTSLLRCCRLGAGHSEQVHHGYGTYTHIHQPQPVRPFATRPSKNFQLICVNPFKN